MTNKALFDKVSLDMSKTVTHSYSTSFSLGTRLLRKDIRNAIYSIYGFVRFADEIVDTFHAHDKKFLLKKFWEDTYIALDQGISLNPILHSFQRTVKQYNIDRSLIDTFLKSMEMDLNEIEYDYEGYKEYILGSAEVVGLMCLKVFVYGDEENYQKLKPSAMSLGSAFQKINFLRDVKADYEMLGRTYFPGVDMNKFDLETKREIEADIQQDFDHALEGIKQLPSSSRFGVYVAYVYYLNLLEKIRAVEPSKILEERVRIPNNKKVALLFKSYLRHNLNLL
jgi:phytoene/squalene synthetase